MSVLDFVIFTVFVLYLDASIANGKIKFYPIRQCTIFIVSNSTTHVVITLVIKFGHADNTKCVKLVDKWQIVLTLTRRRILWRPISVYANIWTPYFSTYLSETLNKSILLPVVVAW